jgi:hypothetical protein
MIDDADKNNFYKATMQNIHTKIQFLLAILIVSLPADATRKTFQRYVKTHGPRSDKPSRLVRPISPDRQVMQDEKEARECLEKCCSMSLVCCLACCALTFDHSLNKALGPFYPQFRK